MEIKEKAQQISLALIRISVQVRRLDLRSRLERIAFQLLENAATNNVESMIADLETGELLINFGKMIYQVEPINCRIICEEIDKFKNQINGHSNKAITEEIQSIFKESSDKFRQTHPSFTVSRKEEIELPNKILDTETEISDLVPDILTQPIVTDKGNYTENRQPNAEMRQSAIIEVIRKYGKAEMKDIITAFPEVTDRTIRNDIRKLCYQGKLEKIGNGGPSTYYVASPSP